MDKSYNIITERTFLRNPAMNLIIKGTIVGKFQRQKLVQSIYELKRIHPLLSSTIKEKNGKSTYLLDTTKTIRISYFVKQSSKQWIDIVNEKEKIPFQLEQQTPIRILVLTRKEDFDFIIIGHHILGDGMSFIYLYRDFMEIYCNDNRELAVRTPYLIKGVQDLPNKSTLNPITKLLINQLNAKWNKEQVYFNQASYERMYKNFHKLYCSNTLIHTIKEEDLSYIKQKCHQNKVTINVLLITAYLYASNKNNLKWTQKITVPINHRTHLKFNPGLSLGNYSTCINTALNYYSKKGFWYNARKIQKQLEKQLHNPKTSFFLLQLFSMLDGSIFDGLYFSSYGSYENKLLTRASKLLQLKKKEDGIDISNLGAIPLKTDYSNYQLKDFVYIPPIPLIYNKVMGIVTLENNLAIAMSYKKKLLTEKEANQLINKMIFILHHL